MSVFESMHVLVNFLGSPQDVWSWACIPSELISPAEDRLWLFHLLDFRERESEPEKGDWYKPGQTGTARGVHPIKIPLYFLDN